jgi:hypothetical protein
MKSGNSNGITFSRSLIVASLASLGRAIPALEMISENSCANMLAGKYPRQPQKRVMGSKEYK